MRHLIVAALAASLTAGCTTAPTVPVVTPDVQQQWNTHEEALTRVDYWNLVGRIAVHNAEDGWTGTIRWTQSGGTYEIDIRGPIGTGSVYIIGSAANTTLKLSDDTSYTGDDAQALLAEHFGWEIPVSSLRHWIVGRPDPASENRVELDASGRLLQLEQADWDVSYKRYTRVKNLELPEKVFAHNRGLDVRLFVDEWNL